MERFHRYYALHTLLKSRRLAVPRREIERALGCSRATALRVIDELRNYRAPIEYDRDANGYRYRSGESFELPGLWFTPSELLALLASQQLLDEAEPSLLSESLAPLRRRLHELLQAEHLGQGELVRRVRMLRMAGRGVGTCFDPIVRALVERRQIRITYHARQDNRESLRIISPQRLTHYRDNWYLDAWCHSRRALRSFALERIRTAAEREPAAHNIPDAELNRHYATAYGIFAGEPTAMAVLRFSARRARWVADEQWHPQQSGRFLDDGSYELQVPYSDPRELVMDVLKHGAEVEVMAPEALRHDVKKALEAALRRYSSGLTE